MAFRPAILLATATLALALSACGGGSDETVGSGNGQTPDSTPATTSGTSATASTPVQTAEQKKNAKLDWVVAVNKICADNKAQITKLGEKIQSEAGAAESTDPTALTVKVLEQSEPLEQQLVKDLRAADVPGSVSSQWTAFVDGLDQAITLFPQLVKSVQSGKQDTALTEKLAKIEAATRPFSEKYALNDCIQLG